MAIPIKAPFRPVVLVGLVLVAAALGLACGDSGGPSDAPRPPRVLHLPSLPDTLIARMAQDLYVTVWRESVDTAYLDTTFTGLVQLSLEPAGAGAMLVGPDSAVAVHGVARFPGVSISAPATGLRLRATSGKLSAESGILTTRPAPADHLGDIYVPTGIAGQPFPVPVRVAVIDILGDTARTYAGPVTLAFQVNPGRDSLRGTRTRLSVGGLATFDDLFLVRADSGYMLQATAPGVAPGYSPLFTIRGATPVRLGFVMPPESGPANFPFQDTIAVAGIDSFGNISSAQQSPVQLSLLAGPPNGAIRGPTTSIPRAGVARFPGAALTLPGNYLLTASTGTLAADSVMVSQAPHTFSSLTVGGTHSCAGQLVFCWGEGTDGQLMDLVGDPGHRSLVPQYALALTTQRLHAGTGATCHQGIYLECWGRGVGGATQLQTQVGTEHGPYVQLSLGEGYACALTQAGAAWCFTSANPQGGVPMTEMNPGQPFTTLAAGAGLVCGLDADSLAHCAGALHAPGLSPTPLVFDSTWAVPGGHRFVRLEAGGGTACGLTAAGAAWCWGENGSGQFGDGTTVSDTIPRPVSGGIAFSDMSVGGAVAGATMPATVCGLTAAGAAWCWGDGAGGVLGSGASGSSAVPVAVAGGKQFQAIAVAGGSGAHACALEPNGSAWCWGANDFGQLGDGTTTASAIPVKVP
ncbi:MAG: hypothetical protein IPI92_05685 [Gemmatimonadetes bacterium]|nr:hypothetical protein [Gemmatimonadota bacterium]MBK7783966.1 hypothetical protein [Gemmatimonadota bacterium]